MPEQHEDVSPATAGGAAAPIIDLSAFEAAGRLLGEAWIARSAATGAYLSGLLASLAPSQTSDAAPTPPLPPFKRRPVLGNPELNMTGDEDGNTWPESVGWALSWGCQLTFGRDEKTAEPYVQVSLSDEDLRRGITQRKATRAQVAEFARLLAEQFGEPNPRDTDVEWLRDEVKRIEDERKADVDRLTRDLRTCEIARNDVRAERDLARDRLAERYPVIEHWQGLAETRGAQVEEFARTIRELTAERNRLRDERDDEHAELCAALNLDTANATWASLRLGIVEVVTERNRLRAKLDQHLADENSAQAANDRLRNEIDLVRRQYQRAVNTNNDLVAERDRLRIALDIADGYRPKFQPGQYVRIGSCEGMVVKPKDVTRVQLLGMLQEVDYPTSVVKAIRGDEEVPF